MKAIPIITAVIIVLILLAWLGLKMKPAAFPAFAKQSGPLPTIPLPAGLPAPVERFYRQTYGEAIPVLKTVVLSGRGSMAPFGFPMPMRLRFIYEVGKDYHAIIHTTFFTLPVMRVNETYIAGKAIGHMPYGIDQGAWYDDSMNMRVYCEALTWFPAALLTDPRVRWEPLDEDSAILSVPFGEQTQKIIVRFDPQTSLVQHFEGMKYRDANHKELWINSIWFSQGKPWIHINIEEMLFNVDLGDAIRGRRE